ncbi:DNA ligase [Caballeronia sp. LZ001]|uniref:ATP-dependent DNA ligase n=1 Tax=Caballeronia sp. LZ001 TaxID=3038553 RepID=UPI00285A9B45|nr:DNA ligase [Caballeronia sp. LZ001]MDR5806546.1 DNA ligase [Caballeronia sp. LZ001]
MLLSLDGADLMHGTLAPGPFSREGWIFEVKYDGYRALVRKIGGSVDLISRNGKSLNEHFPEVVAAVKAIPGSFSWDAELTVNDGTGRTSLERLQRRTRNRHPMSLHAAATEDSARLYVFDMLAWGHHDMRRMRLFDRKAMLRESFADTMVIVYVDGIEEQGELAFERAARLDLEGVMAKRLKAPYSAGYTRDWLKVKNPNYGRATAPINWTGIRGER